MRRAALVGQFAAGAMPWVGWAIVLNLAWEIAQLPLYAFALGTPASSLAFAVAHCTLGDATLALAAYVAAAAATRTTAWPLERPVPGLLVAMAVGLGWTIWAEWNAVYITRAWAYGPNMPLIAGIGLSPLLQWLALPPIALAIVHASARRRSNRRVGRC